MQKIMDFLFLTLINLSFSFFPIWNIENSAIHLMKSEYNRVIEYNLFDKVIDNYHVQLNRTIRINNTGYISENNYILYKNPDSSQGITEFSDIENVYILKEGNLLVCPKGSYHPYLYYYYNSFDKIIPPNFIDNGDWELKCYMQFNEGFLFVSYLNSNNKMYQYTINDNSLSYKSESMISNGIYDFKWTTDKIIDSSIKKPMTVIVKENNELLLKELNCDVYQGQDYKCYDWHNPKILTELKSNYNSYFIENNERYDFYWINYNNYSDFESGYYNESKKITKDNLNIINIIKNEKSPFLFLNKISIKKLKFIAYTKYAYYEIYNEDKNITYYGFIDIILNRIIFNTDKNITFFAPYSNNSMIFIYNGFAYRICAITNDYNTDCIDECPKGQKPIYTFNSANKCKTECNTQFTFIPFDFCIDECDENIYSINEKNECGLCKDLYENKKYKMVNYKGCLENQPKNSHFINKDLYLLACDNGEEFDGKCGNFKCHDSCETCDDEPKDDNNQNCITCKSNYVLQGKNCVKQCLDGYYKNNRKCDSCDNSCKACDTEPNNCKECNIGYYFENDNKCRACSNFCETCLKGEDNDSQNCLSCKKDSEYQYFFNNSCYNECPENTTNKSYICIEKKNNNEKDSEIKVQKKTLLLNIFIIITFILLLIIVFCIIKKLFCESKNQYESLTKEIYTELTN